jgi:hypothetical protein
VFETADLRLFEFLAAERLRLLGADVADALHGLAAVVEAAALERALGLGGGGDRGADVVEDAPAPRLAVAGRGLGLSVAHVRQDFLHHTADKFVGDLHGGIPKEAHAKAPRREEIRTYFVSLRLGAFA